MHFYCQLDYEHIPYPSPSSPYGNLANNGCVQIQAPCGTEPLSEKSLNRITRSPQFGRAGFLIGKLWIINKTVIAIVRFLY
jgi:hypothetical protein